MIPPTLGIIFYGFYPILAKILSRTKLDLIHIDHDNVTIDAVVLYVVGMAVLIAQAMPTY